MGSGEPVLTPQRGSQMPEQPKWDPSSVLLRIRVPALRWPFVGLPTSGCVHNGEGEQRELPA